MNKEFNHCSSAAENQYIFLTGQLHASLVLQGSSIQGK